MNRQYARRSVLPSRQRVSENPVMNSAGHVMAGQPGNVRAEVERVRRELQRKYDKEAQEAEEKRKKKEQKKREEWLKRQEALVRPGYRLGSDQPEPQRNHRRDLVEQQEYVNDAEWERQNPNQGLMDDHYNTLIQQRVQRGREIDWLNRNLAQPAPVVQQANQMDARGRARSSAGATNPQRNANSSDAHKKSQPVTLGTSPLVKPATFLGVYQTPSCENARVQEQIQEENRGHVLGSRNPNPTNGSPTTPRDTPQPNYREEMLAARMKMQERYNEQVQKAEDVKEIDRVTEYVKKISLE